MASGEGVIVSARIGFDFLTDDDAIGQVLQGYADARGELQKLTVGGDGAALSR